MIHKQSLDRILKNIESESIHNTNTHQIYISEDKYKNLILKLMFSPDSSLQMIYIIFISQSFLNSTSRLR